MKIMAPCIKWRVTEGDTQSQVQSSTHMCLRVHTHVHTRASAHRYFLPHTCTCMHTHIHMQKQFKVILDYIVSSRLTWKTLDPVSRKKQLNHFMSFSGSKIAFSDVGFSFCFCNYSPGCCLVTPARKRHTGFELRAGVSGGKFIF